MTMVAERTTVSERLTSVDVYNQVIAQALELSVLHEGPLPLRDELYGTIGVVPVELEPGPAPLGNHRELISNQTVQECGAYKVRGSANAFLRARERAPGLETVFIASAGNAAAGLEQACRPYGVKVVCEATKQASSAKVGTLRMSGAKVNNVHDTFEDARMAARTKPDADPERLATIDAYDAPETMGGQATIGWETLKSLLEMAERGQIDLHRDPIKLFVPVGGGGIIAGIASVVKWAKDQGYLGRENVQVIGAQMEGCDAMSRQVREVRLGRTPAENLFEKGPRYNPDCDGTAVMRPGKLTAALVADPEFVASIMTVTPEALGIAMDELSAHHHVWVEPAGALAHAAATKYAQLFPAKKAEDGELFVTFTTGANISPDLRQKFNNLASSSRKWQETERARRAHVDSMYALGELAANPGGNNSFGGNGLVRGKTRVINSPARG